MTDFDLILAGCGLANGLIALALARHRPGLRVAMVERAGRIGGNHLWSVFDSDVAPQDRWLVEPLIEKSWPGYDVRFPAYGRRLETGYNSCTSERLDAAVRAALPDGHLILGAPIAALTPTSVTLADGRTLAAAAVIDGRGPADLSLLDLGWQKFIGQMWAFDRPHGVDRPVVMDATVPQIDGYRFVYLLPFAPDRLFVEDTYYSASPVLDRDVLAARIAAYAARFGSGRIIHEEAGVLPVAMGGDFQAYWRSGGEGVPKSGLRAGLFHPTTGYSLPDAVHTARLVAGAADLSAAGLHRLLHDHAKAAWARRGFYRLLDRMLFRAALPAARYRVLERFYRLDHSLIERFYAARSTVLDRLRILSGRPPVPVGRAVRALLGVSA